MLEIQPLQPVRFHSLLACKAAAMSGCNSSSCFFMQSPRWGLCLVASSGEFCTCRSGQLLPFSAYPELASLDQVQLADSAFQILIFKPPIMSR